MSPTILKRCRRWLAVGLLEILLLTLWFGMLEPVVNYFSTAHIARGISLRALKRNRALLRQGNGIREARTSVEQSPRWRNFYEGPKPETAILQLEGDLRAIFRDANSSASLTALPATRLGAVTRIVVRVNLVMRVDQLAETLDRIQKSVRQMRVESLTVQAPDFQAAQTNVLLTVQAEVSALVLTQTLGSGAST